MDILDVGTHLQPLSRVHAVENLAHVFRALYTDRSESSTVLLAFDRRDAVVDVRAAYGETDFVSGARGEWSRIEDSRRDLVVIRRGAPIGKGRVEKNADTALGAGNRGRGHPLKEINIRAILTGVHEWLTAVDRKRLPLRVLDDVGGFG